MHACLCVCMHNISLYCFYDVLILFHADTVSICLSIMLITPPVILKVFKVKKYHIPGWNTYIDRQPTRFRTFMAHLRPPPDVTAKLNRGHWGHQTVRAESNPSCEIDENPPGFCKPNDNKKRQAYTIWGVVLVDPRPQQYVHRKNICLSDQHALKTPYQTQQLDAAKLAKRKAKAN